MKNNKITMDDFCKSVGKTEEGIKNGNLDLRCTGITSLPDNLTVGGSLDLSGTGITSLPDNLTVGGSLDLRCTGITSLPDNLTVGGWLDLSGTGITSLPDNLTVGGKLDLRGTGITSLPDNLTVGGWLDLYACADITSLPDNLTVGGWLDLSGTGITDTSKVKGTLSAEARRKIAAKQNMCLIWEWNGRTYIKVDGIFSVVDSHHGNVWRVHQLGCKEQTFIVTDGEHHYAHGDTIDEARKDLVYKICDRDKSEYENLTLDSELTYSEAIECYRVITGACSAGTRNFCENILSDKREKYTVNEIIQLTKGRFGNEAFENFFNK